MYKGGVGRCLWTWKKQATVFKGSFVFLFVSFADLTNLLVGYNFEAQEVVIGV